MNKQTAYWIVRKTGGGTAIEMADKIDPPLTNREGFSSHLSNLALQDKFLDRESVRKGTERYRYFVPKKGKNKKISKGEKWSLTKDFESKLETIQYLNENPRGSSYGKGGSKNNQLVDSLSNYTSDHDMHEIQIMQHAAKRRIELKNCIRKILVTVVRQLLDSGEVIELIYDKDNQVIFKYHPYVSENYSLPEEG